MKKSCRLIVSVILLLLMCSPVALASGHADLGSMLPLWSIIPFVGMLLSIAIFPLVKPHWWEHHQGLVVIIWSVVFLVPFAIGYGVDIALEQLLEIIIGDYLTFVVLLLGLFVVSGNITLRGNLVGAPRLNLFFLLIGSLLASWIGTTGASMLMIRPMLQANQWRKNKVHIFIFFIFMISNIGGSLTPVGDPPLFLGFLRGVPFFWTMRLFPIMILNLAILSVVFFLMDRHFYRKELAAGNHPPILVGEVKKDEGLLRLSGKHNFIFMAAIVGSVILSGFLPQFDAFADQATGALKGLHVYGEVTLPYTYVIQVVIILLAAFLSYKTSKPEDREYNHFTWAPIKEVAILFIGIFITMIPALAIEVQRCFIGAYRTGSVLLDHRCSFQLPG